MQTRLKQQAVVRSAVRSSSPSLLAGRIFDDRKNPMTPTHANKKGVRYRYYVSHALLQGRAGEAGSVARISAPDVEALIANTLRANSGADDDASDREIIERHLGRAVVHRDQITITLRSGDALDAAKNQNGGPTISVPFTATLPLRKGISHSGAVTRTEFGRSQFGSPSFGSRRGGGSPRLERFFSEGAERAAGGEMTLDVEGVLDSGVNRQEALG